MTPHINNFTRLSIEKQQGKRKYESDGRVMVGELVCMYVCMHGVSLSVGLFADFTIAASCWKPRRDFSKSNCQIQTPSLSQGVNSFLKSVKLPSMPTANVGDPRLANLP
jgi:hypothetical protein